MNHSLPTIPSILTNEIFVRTLEKRWTRNAIQCHLDFRNRKENNPRQIVIQIFFFSISLSRYLYHIRVALLPSVDKAVNSFATNCLHIVSASADVSRPISRQLVIAPFKQFSETNRFHKKFYLVNTRVHNSVTFVSEYLLSSVLEQLSVSSNSSILILLLKMR